MYQSDGTRPSLLGIVTLILLPSQTTLNSIERWTVSVTCVEAPGASSRAPSIRFAFGVLNSAVSPRVSWRGPPVILGRVPW